MNISSPTLPSFLCAPSQWTGSCWRCLLVVAAAVGGSGGGWGRAVMLAQDSS